MRILNEAIQPRSGKSDELGRKVDDSSPHGTQPTRTPTASPSALKEPMRMREVRRDMLYLIHTIAYR